jgi:hypothetical protein
MYPFCVPLKGKKIRASRRVVPSPDTPDQAAKHPNAKVHTQSSSTKGGALIEARQPDVAAQMISDLAEGGRIDQVITASGLPPATARALLKRLRTQHLPVQLEVKRLKTAELIDVIDEKIALTLGFMDEVTLSTATASQLAVVFGILSDKRQLLRGEPTQILSVQERSSLDTLMPALLAEAKRRGQSVELTPNEHGEYVPAQLQPVPFEKDIRTGGFRDRYNTEPEK